MCLFCLSVCLFCVAFCLFACLFALFVALKKKIFLENLHFAFFCTIKKLLLNLLCVLISNVIHFVLRGVIRLTEV